MTHEYVVALNGFIQSDIPATAGGPRTAVAWAADRLLAVGSDSNVSAISRGDSTFLDLAGCVVTPLPPDLDRAADVLADHDALDGPDADIGAVLVDAGSLPADAVIEPGAPADLAFWRRGQDRADPSRRPAWHTIALLRGGRFTEGDPRRGPFSPHAFVSTFDPSVT